MMLYYHLVLHMTVSQCLYVCMRARKSVCGLSLCLFNPSGSRSTREIAKSNFLYMSLHYNV